MEDDTSADKSAQMSDKEMKKKLRKLEKLEKLEKKLKKMKKMKSDSSSASSSSDSDYEESGDSDVELVQVKKEMKPANTLPSSELQRLREDESLRKAEKKSKSYAKRKPDEEIEQNKSGQKKRKQGASPNASPNASPSSVVGTRGGLYQSNEVKDILFGIYSKQDDNAIATSVHKTFPDRPKPSIKTKTIKVRDELKSVLNNMSGIDQESAAKGIYWIGLNVLSQFRAYS